MTSTSTTRRARASSAAKTKVKAKTSSAAKAATLLPKRALLDVRGLLDKLKLPGVDVGGLIDSRRKDIEALLAANEQAYRGFEAVTRRQGEMLAEAMKQLTASAKETFATQGASERTARVASLAQEAFGRALANMKEIAELSARSQKQVVDTLNKRLHDGIEEISGRLQPKP